MTRTDDGDGGAQTSSNLPDEVDPNRPEGVSSWVVDHVAAYYGVEPFELEEPLYDSVDPEALDSLFAVGSMDGADHALAVTFSFAGVEVTVSETGGSDATLRIANPDEDESA